MADTRQAVRLKDLARTAANTEVRLPRYDRSDVIAHTVHIGVGGFHRAHQALYLDDLLHLEGTERWGEHGLGILPGDLRMRDALQSQDCLYTLIERSAHAETARVLGSILKYTYGPLETESAIEAMASPATRIVSLTITEGGYFLDDGTKTFMADHPDIQHDLQHSESPTTSLGYITAALSRRRSRGLGPFTVMSCDNLQGNGDVLKRVLLGYAELKDPSLRQWIDEHAAFPNCMVDRITPATTNDDIVFVERRFGIIDAWPVVTEPFLQWVIEDEFCNGRPKWEEVGVEIVTDVAPYEVMKMRLLNGSHLAMAYLGALTGYRYVHEVMEDPLFERFIGSFMEEVSPVVPDIPGVSVEAYKQTLIERFANPTIRDQVTRICSEGSAKLPKWLLPSIVELMDRGGAIDLLCLVVASWILYFQRGRDERGIPLEIIDSRAAELTDIARAAGADVRPMLALGWVFGPELSANRIFLVKVQAALNDLIQLGTATCVRNYCDACAR